MGGRRPPKSSPIEPVSLRRRRPSTWQNLSQPACWGASGRVGIIILDWPMSKSPHSWSRLCFWLPTFPSSPYAAARRTVRCCWGHLAGRLGVLLTDRLVASGEIVRSNEKFVICSAPRLLPRIFGQARSQFSAGMVCLDWSERRPHIGGAVGRALLAGLLERQWLERVPSSRVVTITVCGRRELQEIVGPVDFAQTP